MGLHVGHMTSRDDMRFAFQAVTEAPARIMHIDGYGIAPGCNADMVLLQAADPIEAIRLKATRLLVVRRGRVIARTEPRRTALQLDGRPAEVSLRRPLAAG